MIEKSNPADVLPAGNSNAQDAITSQASQTNNLDDNLIQRVFGKLEKKLDADKPKEVVQLSAFSLRDVANLDPVRWYVKGMISEGSITVLIGEPKTGKTYVAGHLALSLASGKKEWIGGREIDFPDDANVLWLDADMGHTHTLRRMDQIANGLEAGYLDRCPEMFDRFQIFTTKTNQDFQIPRFDFFRGKGIDELIQFIQKNNVKLMFVDTLSAVRGASNENDTKDMQIVMDTFILIRDCCPGLSIVAIHHSPKTNEKNTDGPKYRGSTTIAGSTDNLMAIDKDKADPCYLTFYLQGGRDIEAGRFGLYQSWHQRIDDDGHAMYDENGNALIYYQLEPSELKDHKTTSAIEDYENLLAYIKANPGKNRKELYEARGETNVGNSNVLSDRLSEMVDAGWIRYEKRGRGQYYFPVEQKTGKEENDQPSVF